MIVDEHDVGDDGDDGDDSRSGAKQGQRLVKK